MMITKINAAECRKPTGLTEPRTLKPASQTAPVQLAAPKNLNLQYFCNNISFGKAVTPLQEERLKYRPKLPSILSVGADRLNAVEGKQTTALKDADEIAEMFPNLYGQPIVTFDIKSGFNFKASPLRNVGVILSGGQAPGGHNVISGLYDALKEANPKSKIYGFLGGPSGIIDGKYIELTDEVIDKYRNTGGFDIIGSGRTKLDKEADFEKSLESCKKLGINSVVIIGGDDSNTNAALLAEWMLKNNTGVQVIGCPKTIDGDLKNEQIEASFGFDTAAKTYSELVGNIERDALSAKKYWHFIKVMGRSASHVALEVALQTHPNITLISEEVAAKQMPLDKIVNDIADVVAERAEQGKNYGTVIVPEGLIEFIPKDSLESLPDSIKSQFSRDPHGNLEVSKIDTEKLLMEMVSEKLHKMAEHGEYTGKFSPQGHFLGYEGRCAFPSNFDADYCYSLGYNAAALLLTGKTGYMSTVKNLTAPYSKWQPGGVPLTSMMNIENRKGKDVPVIQKALVELDGKPFQQLAQNRKNWALNDDYLSPGPIQYYGPSRLCDQPTITLKLEHK